MRRRIGVIGYGPSTNNGWPHGMDTCRDRTAAPHFNTYDDGQRNG